MFRQQPLQWLRSGYACNDWRESDQIVRVIEDVLELRIAAPFDPVINATPPVPLATADLRTVLKMLIDSGGALPLSDDTATEQEGNAHATGR